MNRLFTTQDCGFCYLSRCVLTGCNNDRNPSDDSICSKCSSKLPPKGEIKNVRYLEVLNKKGILMANGFLMDVIKDKDGKRDWFLFHCRGGQNSRMFHLLGANTSELKEWINDKGWSASWPKSPIPNIIPFKTKSKTP